MLARISASRRDAKGELLLAGQRVEEMVDSVQYDVWECSTCAETAVLRYRQWMSGFKPCRRCGYRTLLPKITCQCRHCDEMDRSFAAPIKRPN